MCEHRHDLVGVAELRAMLGVRSHSAAYVLSRRKGFPDPVHEGERYCVWDRAHVEAWLERNRPGCHGGR